MKQLAILFFLLITFTTAIHGQQEGILEEKNNKELFELSAQIENKIESGDCLELSKKLLQRAKEKKNNHYIGEAYCQIVFHYSLNKVQLDSAKAWVDKAVTKSKMSDKQKSRCWRFLIYGFLEQGKNNLAIMESKRWLESVNCIEARIDANYCIFETYYSVNNTKMAYENGKMILNAINKHSSLNGYKRLATLTYLSMICSDLKRWKDAKAYLMEIDGLLKKYPDKKKAESLYKMFDKGFYWYASAYYYQNQKLDDKNSQVFMDSLKNSNDNKENKLRYYYSLKTNELKDKGRFAEALAAFDSLRIVKKEMGINDRLKQDMKEYAELYAGLNDLKQSNLYYKRYVEVSDSIAQVESETSTSEFAAIFELDRLNMENKDLQLSLQTERLRTTWILLVIAFVVLLIITGMYLRLRFLCKKLELSEKNAVWSQKMAEKAQHIAEEEHKEAVIAKEKAEKASRMKTSFVQNMTHEIRTPLNGIVGFTQVLTMMFKENEEAKQYTSIIESNTQILLKLIEDMFVISSLESGQKENITDVNLYMSIVNAIDYASSSELTGGKEGKVKIQMFDKTDDLIVKGNEQFLYTLFANLLHNAAKFTSEGSITLDYKLEESGFVIRITDTGIGIPADKQEWVFERFAKIDNFIQGFGLGLSICRQIMELIGGSMYFDPTYTDGARVILHFPK